MIEIKKLEELQKAAKLFIETYKDKKVFAFYGAMGVGKTTFIKALCEELEVVDIVNSPSFAIVYEYKTQGQGVIYHFDFYRIKNIEEAFDFGYEDYFYSDNYCFIEWPEKIDSLLPENCAKVYLEEQPDGSRTIKVE